MEGYGPARTCPSQRGIVGLNSLRGPLSSNERTISDRTIKILVASNGWENLPEKWKKAGELIMSYKTQPWLLTKEDYALIGVLNKASQWEDAPQEEMERGIAILMKPVQLRTLDEITFLLTLDSKYAVGVLS